MERNLGSAKSSAPKGPRGRRASTKDKSRLGKEFLSWGDPGRNLGELRQVKVVC